MRKKVDLWQENGGNNDEGNWECPCGYAEGSDCEGWVRAIGFYGFRAEEEGGPDAGRYSISSEDNDKAAR